MSLHLCYLALCVLCLALVGCAMDQYSLGKPRAEDLVGRYVGELTPDAAARSTDAPFEGKRTIKLEADGSFVAQNMVNSASGGVITYWSRQGEWSVGRPPGRPWSVRLQSRDAAGDVYGSLDILGRAPPYKLVDEFGDPDAPREAVVYTREDQ